MVRYTRGSFIFPKAQSYPHRNFFEEIGVLDSFFGNLGSRGSEAYAMGGYSEKQKWYIYSSCADNIESDDPVYTLEMCMTGLDKETASVFYKNKSSSANQMTIKSGIRNILPQSDISDFEFDPCGYSMNSIEEGALSTIHVTPEEGFSYASFEASGYDLKAVNLPSLIERVLTCFKPAEFSVALHVNFSGKHVQTSPLEVKGYLLQLKSQEELGFGGSLTFQKFLRIASCCSSPKSTLKPSHEQLC